MCFIHTNADDPRFVTTFFVPPYMSLNPLATDGNPLGTSVGDRVKGISCEVACGRIRDIGLCCRKRIPGEPDCPVLRVGECEATGRGITIPFSLHSDVCLGYMSSGACGF